jgi:hypothetical protein
LTRNGANAHRKEPTIEGAAMAVGISAQDFAGYLADQWQVFPV